MKTPSEVLDELSVAAKNMRHWYPKESVIPVEIETYEALVAIARAAVARLAYGHNDTCSSLLIEGWECSCGHGTQSAAIATLGEAP